MPTAGQVTNGANPLWWKGRFRPTSAQCPLVGAFRHSFHFFFYFSCINIFPPADGGGSSKNKSYASTSLKSGVTITLLPAILSGNIFLIRDEKIYMLWSIVLQKSFAKQAHQSYLRIQQIRSMSQWQECGVWIFIHWNCSNKWYRHYWHERHLLIISRNNMLNDSSKNHQINNFYDLGKLKDIGCFNLLTNFWPGKRWIKNRSVAIYRTTTVLSPPSILQSWHRVLFLALLHISLNIELSWEKLKTFCTIFLSFLLQDNSFYWVTTLLEWVSRSVGHGSNLTWLPPLSDHTYLVA